ncbi:MAG: SurA N-terminal domain-containing protein [Diaphorobacter nitroreducens]|uniref:Periplasmic chaperone PpiD n=1 Tax=Acidovorax ebreus (strain TPSY) TaxID=535289 RepID=A0A9J9Q5X0_ACIET|nr:MULTISPECIES: SurA N-terminal domain-containing protein [Diaphorobacter]ACM32659.1 PpiC-type peptidyl-prolyl cis-trans isomerase [[Acidovorax] ebreus TPSY]ASI68473.1 peptidylprolyl isomerase [Diaphorobacter nitroreducens]QJY32761.1 peptidyl-prolyl cis-trans isomerase [Diaphorobacter sp. JS3050]QPN30832.1 SurA N-terminal domain-containing protein [Diaphorobacter sp. JS3051]
MFESIRKHSKIVMFLLFLLIIPSFILVGIDSNYFSGGSPVVARVDGKDITQADWDNAHRMESDRIRAQSPGIDAKLLDSPQARYATLERLVRDRVLQVAAQDMHMLTSDARLARELQSIPQIAALKRADGTLDAEAYRALAGAQGLTPEGLEARIRQDLSVNQVMGGVMGSAFSGPAEARLALDALFQRREIQIARFNASAFVSKVVVTDADLEAYYTAHPAKFQQAEQASVEYVVLDLDAVKAGITLSEDDLRTYYKENLNRLAGKEERRASHILINASKDAPADARTQAKAKAEELLAQVRKAPGSFAEIAKKESQDPGSAPSGGDLGFFGRGAMVKPFEDAVFSMKKGEISDVVETDFGFHIILLSDIKTPRQPSFEELRPSLEAELKQQQAQRKFAEVAEAFANGVYEQADSLQPVADKLKLKIQTADGVTRTPAAGGAGPLANARFLEALFQSDSLQNKRNTEAIEIGTSVLAAGRVTAYQPAMTLPLDKARDQVRAIYIAEKSAELARQEGQAKLTAWKAAPDAASGLTAALTVSRDRLQDQPRSVVDAALRANVDQLPAWTGVDLGAQGYAVVKINRVVPRDGVDDARARMEREQYLQSWASAEALAYYDLLKQRFKVQIKAPRPVAQAELQN